MITVRGAGVVTTVVAFIALTGSCSPAQRAPSPSATATGRGQILEAHGAASSTKLELGLASCDEAPQAGVVENDDEVRIHIVLHSPAEGARGDCRDILIMTLQQPLGERALIDEATGEAVHVGPLEETTEAS